MGEILNQDFLKKEKGFLLCQVLAVQQLSVILGVILMVAAGFVFMIGEEILQIYAHLPVVINWVSCANHC